MSDTLDMSTLSNDPDALDVQAAILQAKSAMIRITGELAAIYAERLTAAVTAEAARVQAEADCAKPEARVERISLEVSEVEHRARLAASAIASPDVHNRLDARLRAAACQAELESLTAKLNEARADAATARTALRLAELEAERTKAATAEVMQAIENPLTSELGQSTTGYFRWFIGSGMYMSEPKSPITRALIEKMLGPSGIGAQVQKDAINAYLSGDPRALAAGGVDVTSDGHTVIRSPGAPPIVTRNPRMSGHQAAGSMDAVPQVPGDAWARAQSAAQGMIS